jgi:DNA-binding transcriptional regulator YhcF (GntR family)
MSKFPYIVLDDQSSTPKYQQLANSIINGILSGQIKKDELLPSLNELTFQYEISRYTAERGYRYLKDAGILGAVQGKGYYVKGTAINQQLRVLLLFNKLSPHKKIIYDSIASALHQNAVIDLYIYNNDFSSFKKLLASKTDSYSHYVIIPHFIDGGDNAHEVINSIDKKKLIILDKLPPNITGEFAAVYENFEKDIFNALHEALPKLEKYHTLKIILPEFSYFPSEILKGFIKFCDSYAFSGKVIHNIAEETIETGVAYINLMEDDLVTLIEKILQTELIVGTDVGVISYNETPVKKIILQGITTISTDFKLMGEKAAELILNNRKDHIEVPFYLTLRPSL